jgi:hypothetical protein
MDFEKLAKGSESKGRSEWDQEMGQPQRAECGGRGTYGVPYSVELSVEEIEVKTGIMGDDNIACQPTSHVAGDIGELWSGEDLSGKYPVYISRP